MLNCTLVYEADVAQLTSVWRQRSGPLSFTFKNEMEPEAMITVGTPAYVVPVCKLIIQSQLSLVDSLQLEQSITSSSNYVKINWSVGEGGAYPMAMW